MLHELGHLLQQDHVINPTLLYWNGRGGTSAAANLTKLSTDPITGIDSDPALTGVKYVLQRDATNNCDPATYAPIQTIPAAERKDLPGCTGLCPSPCIDCFPQYLTALATPPASLGVCTNAYATSQNGILADMPVTISVINGSNFCDTYTWNYDGGVELSSNANKSVVTVKWATAGLHLVSLNIYDGCLSACTTRQKPIDVHQSGAGNCLIAGDISAIQQATPPTNCNSTNGSLLLGIPTQGSLCYRYTLRKGNTTLFDGFIDATNTAAHLFSGLGTGNYTATIFDQITGCYLEKSITFAPSNQLTLSTISAPNYAGEAPCTGEIAVTPSGGTAPFSYTWNTGYTASSGIYNQLCGSPTGGRFGYLYRYCYRQQRLYSYRQRPSG